MRHTQKGFTVAEVLVSMAVLALLMSFVYSILFPSARAVKRAEAKVATQQSALVAVEKLFREAGYTDSRSAVLTETPLMSVSFLSAESPRGTSSPPLGATRYDLRGANTEPLMWKKFVLIYYLAEDEQVSRKEFPYTGGGEIARLKPSQIAALVNDGRYPETRVANGVTDFWVRMSRPPLLEMGVSTAQVGISSQEQTRLETKIIMRNSP